MIFVFDKLGGGLGDRLSGITSAYLFALRTKRKFFISLHAQHESLQTAFYSLMNNTFISYDIRDSSDDLLHLLHCYNSNDDSCSLDHDFKESTILFKGNRANLCRWTETTGLPANNELQKFGITDSSNHYEIAGCILKSVFWPTAFLWTEFRRLLEKFEASIDSYRVALHFRCGDHSFNDKISTCRKSNPEILRNYGACAVKLIKENAKQSSTVYIASDNMAISTELVYHVYAQSTQSELKSMNKVITTPQACHIDRGTVGAGISDDCMLNTIVHWFALSMNHNIMAQCIPAKGKGGLMGSNIFSAFPRSAAIYSLGNNVLICPETCAFRREKDLGRLSHGNWICSVYNRSEATLK